MASKFVYMVLQSENLNMIAHIHALLSPKSQGKTAVVLKMSVDHWHHDCNVFTAWPLNCMWYTAALQDRQRPHYKTGRGLSALEHFFTLTIQFTRYAAYLFTAVLSLAASGCLQSTYRTSTRGCQILWEAETEWKRNGNGGNERKKEMANNMHSQVMNTGKTVQFLQQPSSSSLPEPSSCKRRERTQ